MNYKKILAYCYLLFSGIPTALASSLLASAMQQMKKQYPDKSIGQVKQINSIPSLLLSIAAPIFMLFMNKLTGKFKLVLIPSLILYSIIGTIPILFYKSYTSVIVCRVFLGLFCGITEPFSLKLISKKSVSLFGYRATTMSFVALIFNLTGGLIVDTAGWQYLFLFYSFGVVLALLVGIGDFNSGSYIEIQQKQSTVQSGQPDTVEQITVKLQNIEQKSQIKKFIPVYLTSFISQLSYYILPQSISMKLKQIGVTDALRCGVASGLSMFFNGLASLFLKQMQGFLKSKRNVSIFCLLTTGLSMCGFAFSNNYGLVLFTVSISGLFMGNQLANINSWVCTIKSTPLTLGLNSFCTFFSHFLTSYLFCFKDEQWNIMTAGLVQFVWGIILVLL
ncbi:MFS_permease (Drug) [Hexamita inflata]|uniref:MFS permease (Drug) n=1 Tax=Hexamita inflata TaxID=28002 RepID=A0AA86PBJ8_9EUKA|nr:MFS permease (Drug) [Hexamita inflata]